MKYIIRPGVRYPKWKVYKVYEYRPITKGFKKCEREVFLERIQAPTLQDAMEAYNNLLEWRNQKPGILE